MTPDELQRFWEKVDKNGPVMPGMSTPCWVWTAAKIGPYGAITIERRQYRAHRLSFELHGGTIGDLHVLHRCDNPPCVNPEHLFLGTNEDNVQDRHTKGRDAKGDSSGSRVHPERLPRGERVNTSRLTAAQVVEIRTLSAAGQSRRALAARFGISHVAVRQIALRRHWKHLPESGSPEQALAPKQR